MDDEWGLLGRLRAGDASALDALMDRYAARVHRVAYAITRNEADAEEVTQDVFYIVFRRHEAFAGRSALGSWIYRIAVNAALNKRRRKRAEVETSLDHLLPAFTPAGDREGDRAFLLADWSETPDRELHSAESRRLVGAAIESLPAHYRAVLVLRDVEGLSNEEAAGILGESVASVKSRLHRARMALREPLTRHFGKHP